MLSITLLMSLTAIAEAVAPAGAVVAVVAAAGFALALALDSLDYCTPAFGGMLVGLLASVSGFAAGNGAPFAVAAAAAAAAVVAGLLGRRLPPARSRRPAGTTWEAIASGRPGDELRDAAAEGRALS